MNTHAITALRPPQLLLELVKRTTTEDGTHASAVIRDAIDSFEPEPRNPGDPCPVKSLYARLNSRLADKPVAFSAPMNRMAAYRKKQHDAGLDSLNGLVSLALAQKYGVAKYAMRLGNPAEHKFFPTLKCRLNEFFSASLP
jgi:hypothetical protein